jgi:hypothetical protein
MAVPVVRVEVLLGSCVIRHGWARLAGTFLAKTSCMTTELSQTPIARDLLFNHFCRVAAAKPGRTDEDEFPGLIRRLPGRPFTLENERTANLSLRDSHGGILR